MPYTTSGRKPSKPPRQWESEQERKGWLATFETHNELFEYFERAMVVMTNKVGDLWEYKAKFWVSETVYFELLQCIYTVDINNTNADLYWNSPLTVYGIPVVSAKHMSGRECSLSGKGGTNFSFEVPEKITFELPPKPPRPLQKPGNASWCERERGTAHTIGFLSFPPVFDFVWRWVLWLIDWLNRLAGTGKSKEKTNGGQMDSISDLFEGYERIASETKPKRKYDLLEAILGNEHGRISVSNMLDMYYVRIQSGVNPNGTTKWGKGIPVMSVGYYGNEIVGTPVYIGESPAGLGLSILGERRPEREQMTSLSDLFEDYEDDDIKEKPEGSYGTYNNG